MAPRSASSAPAGKQNFFSFLRGALKGPPSGASTARENSLGDIWSGEGAETAHRQGNLRSDGGGKSVRIAFRNLSPFPLILCWVSETGKLHHFYQLPATGGDISINGLPANMIGPSDHMEATCGGHAFCLASAADESEAEWMSSNKAIAEGASIIAGYRPNDDPRHHDDGTHVQLITIGWDPCAQAQTTLCCNPFGGLRGFRKRPRDNLSHPYDDDNDGDWIVRVRAAIFDETPFDTTTKAYIETELGGWPVRLEENWHGGNPEIENRLAQDIERAAELLPEHAREYLRENCPIWVNKSICYGPKICPVDGRGCCYHPDMSWLVDNGLHAEKAKCIEVNSGQDYWKDVDLWRPGGLVLHELSHAYHHSMLKNGYRNKEIADCYKQAMEECLYACVRVHGNQGPEAKAYACTNCMEYFAELSAAFLGGLDGKEEYNKWYPFNRKQIKEHDPRAYALLARLWQVDVE